MLIRPKKYRLRAKYYADFLPKPPKPGKKIKRDLSLLKRIVLLGIALFILITVVLFAIVLSTLPPVDNAKNIIPLESSVILDRNGGILYSIHGDENRKTIPMDDISPYIAQATLSIEDDQFYKHMGIDIAAILKAVCSELHVCGQARGGSTITQQYVKNAFLTPERTYTRKFKEILLALKLEHTYTKDEILELYLNRIPYGSNIYGVEVAAQKFFGKSASGLTIAESAIMASIPKSSTYYFPYGNHKYAQINLGEEEILKRDIRSEQELVDENPDFISKGLLGKTYTFGEGPDAREIYVKGRVDFVLQRMMDVGYISASEMETALEKANNMEFKEFKEDIISPHFVLYVRELLEAKYGKDKIEQGGLKITTTIDRRLQDIADSSVEKFAERNETAFKASNASLVALDPDTGQILAMVGSRDYWNDEIDGKVNVALRPRLPGSSFKPIVYAAAFLQGYAPSTVLYDVKTAFGGWYEPENFDGEFRGPVTMRQALGASLNIPAVKSAYLADVPNILDLARNMGIQLNQPDSWYGLSLGLGAGEARLIDMVGAYSTFANGGYKVEPVAILKIEDRHGNILEEYKPDNKPELVLDPQAAYLINNILSDPDARPDPYWRERLTIPGQINGAKTGTSNKKKNDINYPFDVWTMGYTRRLAAGVWAGNADGTHLSLKASGLDVAAPIWRDFMTEATKDSPKKPFTVPEGIKWIKVAKRSGKLPTEFTPEDEIATGIFASFNVPKDYDDSYQTVKIDKISGKLATEFTPEDAVEEKAYYNHHSILRDNANWENAVRAWAEENDQDEEPPTEYDDVHTADTVKEKPQIIILSPSSKSTVAPPSLGVWVSITSPAGVKKVDYYWDEELVNTSVISPYKGSITIPKDTKKGSSHTIKAIVFDELYRSSAASVTVKIGKDDKSPSVSFIYPPDDARLPAGSSIPVQIDARDSDGDIKQIDFYQSGTLIKQVTSPPYTAQMTVPEKLGTYRLKVIVSDYAGNETTKTVTIESIRGSEHFTGESRIIKPSSNSSFDQGDNITIKAFLSEEEQRDLKQLTILAKKKNGLPLQIISTPEIAGIYNFIWQAPPAGTYELYMKVMLKDGILHFSRRVPVVVR